MLAAVLFVLLMAPPQGSPQKEMRHRFDMVATRAIANFHSADSLEKRLNEDGATLHPQLVALRLRIDAAIREARAELDRGDLPEAGESIDRAEALLDRFARKLGGD